MPRPVEIYLDIETDWNGELTVVGFCSSVTGIVQLVGDEITPLRLRRRLPKCGRLFTYNGHSFDLVHIKNQLGLNFRDLYESWDLRWICQRHGYCGGQKAIEEHIGFCRPQDSAGLCGRDAIVLWRRFARGDEDALDILLSYNAQDLRGLVAIKRFLSRSRLLGFK